MSSEDGQKKQGIVSKLADKLHIGHKKKNSTSSAGTSDDVMTEVGAECQLVSDMQAAF